MAYNHGKAERRWRLWKENEEKALRECGVDENTIEEIRAFDRTEFNSDRRFYTRLNDVREYIAETAMQELLRPRLFATTGLASGFRDTKTETSSEVSICYAVYTFRCLLLCYFCSSTGGTKAAYPFSISGVLV